MAVPVRTVAMSGSRLWRCTQSASSSQLLAMSEVDVSSRQTSSPSRSMLHRIVRSLTAPMLSEVTKQGPMAQHRSNSFAWGR